MAPQVRDWDHLAPATRRRWIAQEGGSRRLPPPVRERRARRAYEAGASLGVEHTGHGRFETVFRSLPTNQGVVDVVTIDRVEARRAGEYASDIGGLLEGNVDPEHFRQRWMARSVAIGNLRLEADPDRVIAMLTEAGPPDQPFYERRVLRRR